MNDSHCGILAVQRREEYIASFSADGYRSFDDEAHDLLTLGVPFSQCIQRPDGISIHVKCRDITYDIHFNEHKPEAGHYAIRGGAFNGSGHVVGVRRAESPSFPHYYYIKVVSHATNHFIWRIGINHFSRVVSEQELYENGG